MIHQLNYGREVMNCIFNSENIKDQIFLSSVLIIIIGIQYCKTYTVSVIGISFQCMGENVTTDRRKRLEDRLFYKFAANSVRCLSEASSQ